MPLQFSQLGAYPDEAAMTTLQSRDALDSPPVSIGTQAASFGSSPGPQIRHPARKSATRPANPPRPAHPPPGPQIRHPARKPATRPANPPPGPQIFCGRGFVLILAKSIPPHRDEGEGLRGNPASGTGGPEVCE